MRRLFVFLFLLLIPIGLQTVQGQVAEPSETIRALNASKERVSKGWSDLVNTSSVGRGGQLEATVTAELVAIASRLVIDIDALQDFMLIVQVVQAPGDQLRVENIVVPALERIQQRLNQAEEAINTYNRWTMQTVLAQHGQQLQVEIRTVRSLIDGSALMADQDS